MLKQSLAVLAAAALMAGIAANPAGASGSSYRIYAYDDSYRSDSYRGDSNDDRYNDDRGDYRDCQEERERHAVGGTIIGGLFGGLIGNSIGRGGGRGGATIVGVIVGGMIGNSIGRDLPCSDRRYMSGVYYDGFEHGVAYERYRWRNGETGDYGYMEPREYYRGDDGRECRDYTQTIYINGHRETGHGTACRRDDGTWEIVR